jgi:hypothetical protein
METAGFSTEMTVLWFLGFDCKPWFHLLSQPLKEIFVVSDFIQHLLAHKHIRASAVSKRPKNNFGKYQLQIQAPHLESASMFHTRCLLCL